MFSQRSGEAHLHAVMTLICGDAEVSSGKPQSHFMLNFVYFMKIEVLSDCMDWTLMAGQALRIIGAPTRLPILELFQWCIIVVWSINR